MIYQEEFYSDLGRGFESNSSSDNEGDGLGTCKQDDRTFLDSVISMEDLVAAIDSCKKEILETGENTEARKDLVSRLIKLRIRVQDLKDRQERPGGYSFETRGHTFVCYHEPKRLRISGVDDVRRIYCQVCLGGIWVHLQSSQHCSDCGFSVHSACISEDSIKRECVAQKVRTQPDFILDICPEISLPTLKYCCAECDKKFAPAETDPSREPRLCDYTGLSFCPSCHWNSVSVTPARIIHNWDFEPRPVSQATAQYLRLMYKKPVINICSANPKLFAVVPELDQVDQFRRQIILMKKYLMVCRVASNEKLLLRLAGRQHFVDGAELYSLEDLIDVNSGLLTSFLSKVSKEFAEHIRNCVLCLAKGFFCEICGNNNSSQEDVIFPFDDRTSLCQGCEAVFHQSCFKEVDECPRCFRIRSKKAKKKEALNDIH